LAGGKTFAEAAKQAGLQPEKVEGLSVFDPDLEVPKRQLAAAAVDLPAGTLSDFVPSPEGGFAVFVEERGATDEKTAAEQRPRIESGIREGKEMLLVAQWLATARQESGLEVLRPLM
jgi:parvulin-like peptidyl-prolyl isomerase